MKKFAFFLALVLALTVSPIGLAEEVTADDLMVEQAEIDASIWAEIESGAYTIEDPFVLTDPYSLSPLTAILGFVTEKPTTVEVTIKGEDEATTVSHSFNELSTVHALPIYGLYAGKENEVAVTILAEDGESTESTVMIETEALPSDIARAEIKALDAGKIAPGFTFFSTAGIGSNYPHAIDANGHVRWYLSNKNLGAAINLLCLENGNFMVGSGEVVPDAYINQTAVYELTPMGKMVKEFAVYGVHHDIKELPDGNLLIGASKEGRESINDYIVKVDRMTGEVLDEYDLMEIIPMDEYVSQPHYRGTTNWFHNNCIWYDEEDDAIILSGRTQDMIIKISRADKSIIWALSENADTYNEQLAPYMLTPSGEPFEYPTAQHGSMILPDRRLLLFDNTNRVDDNDAGNSAPLYSRAVIYTIDEENMTVTPDWSYGEDRPEIYSSYVSDTDYLGENHYLVHFGGISTEVESSASGDASGEPVERESSTVVELLNDEVIYEAELTGGISPHMYKAERHEIYQNAVELTPGE